MCRRTARWNSGLMPMRRRQWRPGRSMRNCCQCCCTRQAHWWQHKALRASSWSFAFAHPGRLNVSVNVSCDIFPVMPGRGKLSVHCDRPQMRARSARVICTCEREAQLHASQFPDRAMNCCCPRTSVRSSARKANLRRGMRSEGMLGHRIDGHEALTKQLQRARPSEPRTSRDAEKKYLTPAERWLC